MSDAKQNHGFDVIAEFRPTIDLGVFAGALLSWARSEADSQNESDGQDAAGGRARDRAGKD